MKYRVAGCGSSINEYFHTLLTCCILSIQLLLTLKAPDSPENRLSSIPVSKVTATDRGFSKYSGNLSASVRLLTLDLKIEGVIHCLRTHLTMACFSVWLVVRGRSAYRFGLVDWVVSSQGLSILVFWSPQWRYIHYWRLGRFVTEATIFILYASITFWYSANPNW